MRAGGLPSCTSSPAPRSPKTCANRHSRGCGCGAAAWGRSSGDLGSMSAVSAVTTPWSEDPGGAGAGDREGEGDSVGMGSGGDGDRGEVRCCGEMRWRARRVRSLYSCCIARAFLLFLSAGRRHFAFRPQTSTSRSINLLCTRIIFYFFLLYKLSRKN
jgi:hypothetical protein